MKTLLWLGSGWVFGALTVAVAHGDSRPAGEGGAPRIVNIINFIRGVEPRAQIDLLEPVVQQIRLVHAYDLPATFLIQYDALTQPRFVDLLKRELNDHDEIGAWLEVVQPQVEAAGLTWRGRFPWDWHSDVGFTIGYTPAERERLIDVYMTRFQETFGRLPRSVGCWLLDAPTLNHLSKKYGIVAACICKDQVGTDGYTLWGGYWNQAYYPSRANGFMPAQSRDNQIPIPIFRMLGSDPIHQYDQGLGTGHQGVISLEPAYPEAGGNPEWVRWFFDVNFKSPCLAFGYAQVGQENSFGWPAMADGLTDQVRLLAEWSRAGRVRVETLQQSGQWYRRTYPQTPATAVTALRDLKPDGRQSIWYDSRFYRVNLLWDSETWRIRDAHLFNERYAERYLTRRVTTHACVYDTLPVMDGYNWSSRDRVAGIRPVVFGADGERTALRSGALTVTEASEDTLQIVMPCHTDGKMTILLEPTRMRFDLIGPGGPASWGLELTWDHAKPVAIAAADSQGIDYQHNGFAYRLRCTTGTVEGSPETGIVIRAREGRIELDMDSTKDQPGGKR
jgi:hypothetical protein